MTYRILYGMPWRASHGEQEAVRDVAHSPPQARDGAQAVHVVLGTAAGAGRGSGSPGGTRHRRRRGTRLRQSRWYSAPPQARDEAQVARVVLGGQHQASPSGRTDRGRNRRPGARASEAGDQEQEHQKNRTKNKSEK